jgi:putative nucleotidyltransferase with HDIG domain
MTVSVLPILFAAVLYGPLPAMAVAGLGLVGDFRPPYVRWMIWTSLRVLSGGLAGMAALLFLTGEPSFGLYISAAAAATTTEAVVDALLGAGVVSARRNGTAPDYLRSMRPILFATVPLYTSVIALLAYAYREVSVWSVALFLGPALGAHTLYRLYQDQRETAHDLASANERLEKANLSFASALVATLDARDRYTAGHSAAVARYARGIAARMGLSDNAQQLAELAGLVHDIGKIGLPPGLLEKTGPLSAAERHQMESHSEIGERILGNVEDYGEIAKIVRHHHERVDGRGYPDTLGGSEIPLLSRIIAVADAYDAMTSDRPYRDAMPSHVARLRLAQAVETQFDTAVVAAFEAILVSEASESDRILSVEGPRLRAVSDAAR